MKEEKFVIGKTLKNARSAKKIPIEKASKETKIAQTYLKAIEDEDFTKIPGDVVLKGFIRVYADFLGVDPAPLIAELFRKNRKDKPKAEPVQAKIKKTPAFDGQKFVKVLVVAVFLILLTAGLFSFAGFLINSVRNASVSKEPTVQITSPAEDVFEIRAEILEKTWLLVEADGKNVFKGIAFPGDERAWTADKKIFVKIGNAAGIRLSSGGKELLAPGKRGEIVSKEFLK
ncbi:MAG: RodZ domain-containing protein [Candidatus Margulisiibacteriota bacterium]